MFKKILIANRGGCAEGASAKATNCRLAGAAGHAVEFKPGAHNV